MWVWGNERCNGVCPSEGQHLNGVVDLHCHSVIPVPVIGFPLFICFCFCFQRARGGSLWWGDVEMRRDSRSRFLFIAEPKTTPRILSNLVADNISNQIRNLPHPTNERNHPPSRRVIVIVIIMVKYPPPIRRISLTDPRQASPQK